jgi:hypothetical protein
MALQGKCVNSCPTGTYRSTNMTCMPCHPDCNTCSGGEIGQCTSCKSQLPVLLKGRCLLACSSSQYYDGASSCQDCDPSCSSCVGPGPGNCLTCSNSEQELAGGYCVDSPCNASNAVIPGLGACLPQVLNPTSSQAASHTQATSQKGHLASWKIFLIFIGTLIFTVCLLLLWRRQARKRREEKTNEFSRSKCSGLVNTNMRNGYDPYQEVGQF